MTQQAGQSTRRVGRSLWTTATMPTGSRLDSDARAEACVIGAGIAGLSTAFQLAREGRKVIVLDDGPVGGGMTSLTTAHLVTAVDDRYQEIERLHGADAARMTAESHVASLDAIEQAVEDEGIACGFSHVDGWLFLGPEQDVELLEREMSAAHRAGLEGVELQVRAPGLPFDTGPCLRFPRQGQVHPLRYLAGLARAIEKRGGRICSPCHATKIEDGSPCRVHAGDHVIEADVVVVATNVPVNDRFAIQTKMAAYTTYVIAARIPRGSLPASLWWDTSDPYHYVRTVRAEDLEGDSDVLVVGGEDHRSGQEATPSRHHARLEEWMRLRFHMAGDVVAAWGGQVMEPVDSLAFIGRNPGDDNVFVVTGDSGTGMTHGSMAGLLLTDLILGRENEWEELYDPSRRTLKAGLEWTRENLATGAGYARWLAAGDVQSVDEIPRGSGAVIVRGLHRLACYRDPEGTVHERSATCPHLGGVVRWSDATSTWECPCHGSRFDPLGRVVVGPANEDLPPAPAGAALP